MARQTAQERSTNVPTKPVVESNTEFSEGVCSGYCTGWIEALTEDRRILYSPADRR